MFEFNKESQLRDHIATNFNEYFDFQYKGKEINVGGGYVDLVGEDADCIYLIELKKKNVSYEAVEQLKSYILRYKQKYKVSKMVRGIVAAPVSDETLDVNRMPSEISIKEIEGVKCLNKNPQPNHSRNIQVRIGKRTPEHIKRWVENQGPNASRNIEKVLNLFVAQFGEANIENRDIQTWMAVAFLKAHGELTDTELNKMNLKPLVKLKGE